MTTLRVYGASITSPPTFRVYGASLGGAVIAQPKFRVYAASLTGTVAVGINPIRSLTALEPGTPVTFTVTLTQGLQSAALTWTQLSGPPVTLTKSGLSASFTAPSVMPSADPTVVLGVTATVSGSTSAQVTASATILPQTQWAWSGTTWVGATAVPLG